MNINTETKNIIIQRYQNSQKLLNKCLKVLRKLNFYYEKNNFQIDSEIYFAKNFYHHMKSLINHQKNFYLILTQKMGDLSNDNIENIIDKILKQKNKANNEAFVDDLNKMLNFAEKQDYVQKFGSKVMIDYFLNFVIDQYDLSKIEVNFYQNLFEIVNDKSLKPDENELV